MLYVTVIQADIDTALDAYVGDRDICCHCPLANAVKRETSAQNVEVNCTGIKIDDGKWLELHDEAWSWVRRFDTVGWIGEYDELVNARVRVY